MLLMPHLILLHFVLLSQWPEQLLAEKELIGQWQFPTERKEEQAPEGAVEQLKHYMGLLRTRVTTAVTLTDTPTLQQFRTCVFALLNY